jgi:hypothetical protein
VQTPSVEPIGDHTLTEEIGLGDENLTAEERAERESLKAALAEYHANPGKYGIPERGPDNRWHLKPLEAPPRMSTGFARPT